MAKKLFLWILTSSVVMALAWNAQARLSEKKKAPLKKDQEISLATATAPVEPNINWKDWENQFSDSLESSCKGRNCQFQDKTASEAQF